MGEIATDKSAMFKLYSTGLGPGSFVGNEEKGETDCLHYITVSSLTLCVNRCSISAPSHSRFICSSEFDICPCSFSVSRQISSLLVSVFSKIQTETCNISSFSVPHRGMKCFAQRIGLSYISRVCTNCLEAKILIDSVLCKNDANTPLSNIDILIE